MKLNLNTEKRTLIILAVFTVITLTIIFGIIFPTIRYIRNLEEETNSLRVYLEKKYENTRNIRTSKKKIDEIESIVAQYPDLLFYRGDELKLITSLERLASNNKVIQKINSSNLDKPGETVNFSLTLSGDYQNILKYLSSIEKEDFYFTITNLQISSAFSTQNNNPSATIMNLDLLLYVNER
ncbi:MAG: hypothetical protein WCV83_03160 [Candidatus Magasanikbacteria bacterium]|jgi:Tfp pilus assembly protein PilO